MRAHWPKDRSGWHRRHKRHGPSKSNGYQDAAHQAGPELAEPAIRADRAIKPGQRTPKIPSQKQARATIACEQFESCRPRSTEAAPAKDNTVQLISPE